MSKLLVQAFAKINLNLKVGRKVNALHLIDSVMQNISLSDFLEFEKSDTFKMCGEYAFHGGEENLIFRAVKLFQLITGKEPPCKITLYKVIPEASGLGGGSSDAAATLVGLNKLFEAGIGKETLMDAAITLGSDVPFFIEGGKCRVQGTGEAVEPLPFEEGEIVLARPHVRLSTRHMYEELDKARSNAGPQREYNNDFEILVPRLGEYAWTEWIFKEAKKFECQPLLCGKGPTTAVLGERRQQFIEWLAAYDFNGDLYKDVRFVSKSMGFW